MLQRVSEMLAGLDHFGASAFQFVQNDFMKRKYLPRIADSVLHQALCASGAVYIQGPKWCGKTWTALQQAKSVLLMQDPDQTG